MIDPENIYEVLDPMYYCVKVLGLSPFTITKKGYRKSVLNSIYSVIVVLWLEIYTTTIIFLLEPGSTDTVIYHALDFLDTVSSQAGMFVILTCGVVHLNDVLLSLQEMNSFDKSIHLGFSLNLKREFKKSKVLVGLGLLSSIAFIATCFYLSGTISKTKVDALGEFMFHTSPTTFNMFVILQFSVLVLCLKQRFSWLNGRIAQITKINPTWVGTSITPCFSQEIGVMSLDNLRRMYCSLYTISKRLNRAYSLQLLMVLWQNFVSIVLAAYLLGKVLILNLTIRIPYEYYVLIGIVFAESLTQMFLIVTACSTTANEARKIGRLIHTINSKENKRESQLELTFFSLQLLHQNVEFTACGIFVLDRAFLTSIISAVITYLVFIIQLNKDD